VKYLVFVDGCEVPVEITENGESYLLKVNDRELSAVVVGEPTSSRALLLLNNNSYDTEVFARNGTLDVFMHGREFECTVEDERLVAIRKVAGAAAMGAIPELKAPMPGLVVKLLKQPGDEVKKGEPLVVVEAMKMENELKAPADGVIKEIKAEVGKPVDKGAVLVTLTRLQKDQAAEKK
jgi:biotin carboxyl carrier protein